MDLQSLIDNARSVGGRPFTAFASSFASLGHMLLHQASSSPDKTCLVYYDEHGQRTEYTYAHFLTLVTRVAAFLRRINISSGSRVATLAYNHTDTVVQYFAAWFVGATVVPLNASEDDDRIAYILDHSRADLLFVRSDFAYRLDAIRARMNGEIESVLVGDDEQGSEPTSTWSGILNTPHSSTESPVWDAFDLECLLVYTSGTTGNPKGVVLTHGNLLADAAGISDWHAIEADTSMMCVLPVHHVNGIVVTLVTPLLVGASVILNRKFQSSTFFERIAVERVAVVSVVPTLLAFLLQSDIDTSSFDIGSLRHVICGAGPLTCELAARFVNRFNVRIIHGYGLSETTCYSCFLPIDLSESEYRKWMNDHGFPSIGVAIPQNDMDIQTPNGSSVPAGERGEIVIRGHNVMKGYYDDVEANQSAFSNGWFRSGDEGFFLPGRDGKKYYFITGRLKELIIRGGVNISPLEIDEVLNSHPKVDAAIAVGFDNTWYGEEIGAYVRRSDHTLTESELMEWCGAALPFFKTPKIIVFGDDIPVTSTGKYQRNRVRHFFDQHRDTQFREARKEA